MAAPQPSNESQRLAKLLSYNILDTEGETAYDDITRLVADICDVPIAVVSLVDRDRQWFKSVQGLQANETSREVSFCAHAILQPEEIMVVPDATQDPRFLDNPLVTGEPYIRFYAGAPIVTSDGFALGSLCALGTQPRELSETQRRSLAALSRLVINQIEQRETLQKVQQKIKRERTLERLINKSPGMMFQFRMTPDGESSMPYVSDRCEEIYGYTASELQADAGLALNSTIPEHQATMQQAIQTSAATMTGFDHSVAIVDRQGQQKWIQIQSTPEREADGSIVWTGVLMDITERTTLEQERDRLLAILEATPDMVAMADAHGQNFYLNPAGQALLEIPAAETQFFRIVDAIAPEYWPTFETEVLPTATREGFWQGKSFLISRSNEITPVAQTVMAHKDRHGQVQYFSTVLRDIRETAALEAQRRQAEAELKRSHSLLDAVINGIQDLIFVKNRDFSYRLVNQAFTDYFNGGKSLVGQNDFDFLTPTDAKVVRSDDQEVMAGQRTQYEETIQTELGPRDLLTKKKVLQDADGTVIGLLGIATDITERKQIEKQVEAARRFLEVVLNTIPQAVIWKDQDLVFQGGNKNMAKLMGFRSPAEIVGKTDYDASCTQAEAERYRRSDREVMVSGQPQLGIVVAMTQSDGCTRWLRTNKMPLRDAAGKVNGLLATAEDITDIKLAQEALEQRTTELQQTLETLKRTQHQVLQAEKMSSLGRLVAGIAHEINNPVGFIASNLTHVKNYAQDLIELVALYQSHQSLLPSAAVDEIETHIAEIDLEFLQADFGKLLGSIGNGADRISTIVKSLRTFSRLDEAQYKDIDLHESLDSTLTVLKNRLRRTRKRPEINIVKDYSDLPRVECFAGQINEVLMHILNNAIDALNEAVPDQPEISLWTYRSSEHTVAITIADNGSGIPKDVRDRIFDPFFTTKPIGTGTGMGLSTSYQIITETHEGNLWYVPVTGGGSQFIIELPIRLKHKTTAQVKN